MIIPVGTVTSAKEKLISRCATKVVENVERQLSAIVFFQHDHQMDSEVLEKMKFTPLTNSACESRMAQLDVKIKVTGGSAPVQTISDQQVVFVNKYLLKDECSNPQTIKELFCWARNSDEVMEANQLQEEFLGKGKMCKVVAMKAKEVAKE